MRLFLLFLLWGSVLVYSFPLEEYRIAVIPEATLAEQTAAEELQSYLAQCSGVTLPILSYAEGLAGPLFVVGGSEEGLEASGHSAVEELKPDQIVLWSVGDRLHLFGARPRGTLYAVYEFLEESVGILWLSAEVTVVPRLSPSWEVPAWNTQYAPPLYMRSVQTAVNGNDPAFFSHLRHNGFFQPADDRYGGFRDLSFRLFVHTFEQLLPPKKYFSQHPEWYAYRREPFQKAGRKANAQLCLTNGAMRQELVKNTLASLREDSQVGFISISQNDNVRFCQCPKCEARMEELGSITDLYLELVNQVAEAVALEFPKVMVETLAYRFTRHPPKSVRPRENVVIRMCTIEAASFQNLTTPGPNSQLYEDMTGWAPWTRQMMVWDYTTVFRKYWQPHPNWETLGPNLRFFRDCGAISVFEQNGSGPGGGKAADLPELRNWLLSKLMWNPDRDTWSLIETFIRPYYGPGADFIRKYLRTTIGLAKGSDNCYTTTTLGWLPDSVLRELWWEGESLYQDFKEDATYASRLMAAVLPLAMSAMERGFLPPSSWTFAEYADELVRRLYALGISSLTEHASAPGHTPELWRKVLPLPKVP